MRFDVANDARSCLGCGRTCADTYSFCGRCTLASKFPEPRLITREVAIVALKRLLLWTSAIALGVIGWYAGQAMVR